MKKGEKSKKASVKYERASCKYWVERNWEDRYREQTKTPPLFGARNRYANTTFLFNLLILFLLYNREEITLPEAQPALIFFLQRSNLSFIGITVEYIRIQNDDIT